MKKIGLFLLLVILFTACGDDDEQSKTPVACFTYTSPENTVFKDDIVDFLNCSSDAGSYHWDFGDGSTSTDENPSHSFSQAKTYDVVLTAYGKGDPGGTESDTMMLKIKVYLKAIH